MGRIGIKNAECIHCAFWRIIEYLWLTYACSGLPYIAWAFRLVYSWWPPGYFYAALLYQLRIETADASARLLTHAERLPHSCVPDPWTCIIQYVRKYLKCRVHGTVPGVRQQVSRDMRMIREIMVDSRYV